jgi:hypothetical protein
MKGHSTPSISIFGSTVLLLDLGRFLSSLIVDTVDRTPLTGISPSQDRYLHTEDSMNTNKHTQASMSQVGFKHTIPRRHFVP